MIQCWIVIEESTLPFCPSHSRVTPITPSDVCVLLWDNDRIKSSHNERDQRARLGVGGSWCVTRLVPSIVHCPVGLLARSISTVHSATPVQPHPTVLVQTRNTIQIVSSTWARLFHLCQTWLHSAACQSGGASLLAMQHAAHLLGILKMDNDPMREQSLQTVTPLWNMMQTRAAVVATNQRQVMELIDTYRKRLDTARRAQSRHI